MRRFLHGLRYMGAQDYGWLTAKLVAGVIMPLSLLEAISRSKVEAINQGTVSVLVMTAIMLLMLGGGLLSIVGILLRGTQYRPLIVGYAFELGGLVLLMISPVLLAVPLFITAITKGGPFSGTGLCLALATLFIARYIDLLINQLASRKKPEVIAKQVHRPEEDA